MVSPSSGFGANPGLATKVWRDILVKKNVPNASNDTILEGPMKIERKVLCKRQLGMTRDTGTRETDIEEGTCTCTVHMHDANQKSSLRN